MTMHTSPPAMVNARGNAVHHHAKHEPITVQRTLDYDGDALVFGENLLHFHQ